jgi:hypothetical protein
MAQDKQHFPLGKVKAFKAYFEQSRKSAKGKPEYGDLETTVKLCEQLIALMEQGDSQLPARASHVD